MTKEELYHIQDGDLGSVVAAGLKKNFEGIVDDVAVKTSEAPKDGKTYGRNNGQWEDLSTTFATKEELGEIGSVLDTINGEVI